MSLYTEAGYHATGYVDGDVTTEGYVEEGYHTAGYVDGDIMVGGYVDDDYYVDGYTEGSEETISLNVSKAVKFFIKDSSSKTKDQIVTAIVTKLDELNKELGLVSDLRDGKSYVVVAQSKQEDLSSNRAYVDVASSNTSVEIIDAGAL